MSINIRLPNVTATTSEGKLQQMQNYMYQLVEQLNWALNNFNSAAETTALQQGKKSAKKAENEALTTFNDIKGLIIKSADIVNAYYEEVCKRLEGVYVAQSVFGTYKEETSQTLVETSKSVNQQYENIQAIGSSLDDVERDISRVEDGVKGVQSSIIAVTANIKTGLLYHNDLGVPVYGVEVGQTTEMNGVETFNRFARFTADRLSFYDQNGDEVAYISNYKLYIRNGEFLESVKLGGYKLDVTDGIAFKWEGVSG